MSPAQQRRAVLTERIIAFHAESDHVYGSPRILADLRAAGETVSAKTVAKLMRASGITGISPRAFTPVTTLPGPDPQPLPDLVGRVFDRGELNAVWTSDVTYLRTDEGWLYLCAVRDGCSRRVVGWAIEDHLRTDLVETALRRAVTLRGEVPREGDLPRGSRLPIHFTATRRRGERPADPAIRRPHRGVLGQRRRRIVLLHAENGILQSLPVGNEKRREEGSRSLDRGTVQPAPPALLDRHAQPRTLRGPPPPGGTGRMTACPSTGVSPIRGSGEFVGFARH